MEICLIKYPIKINMPQYLNKKCLIAAESTIYGTKVDTIIAW